MIWIEFDADQLKRLRKAIETAPKIAQEELMRWGLETGAQLQSQVLRRTPSRTGSLRNSIQNGLSVEPLGGIGRRAVGPIGVERLQGDRIGGGATTSESFGVSVVIGSNEQYAPWVELGTNPHKIRVRNAKALAFEGAGGTVFAREVNHPGTKPVRMFGDALEASEGAIEESVRSLVDRIMERVFGSVR